MEHTRISEHRLLRSTESNIYKYLLTYPNMYAQTRTGERFGLF